MAELVVMPKYEVYKSSGVEWLGDIPNEWDLVPGFRAYSENKRNNKGLKEERVLSLSYGKIIIKPKEKLVGLVPESFETYQIVEPGDLIIRCMDLQNDKTSLRTGLAKDHGIITSAYLNLKINENFDSKFLYYYLHSLDTTKALYKFGTGLRQNLSFKDFYRLPIFDIPKSLQTAIASFLDNKTVQIDAAITIKEKQIELLKERKQIIIQQAVTQGLNPYAPMKDTSVDWIGEIPKHWELVSFRRISSLRQGLQISIDKRSEEKSEYSYEYITTKSIHNPTNPKHYIDNPAKRVICNSDDILLGRTGNTGEVVTGVHGVFHNNFFMVDYNREKIDKNFLVHFLNMKIIQNQIMLAAGVTTIPDLNHGDFLSLPVVLCPLDEQKNIASYISKQFIKIDEAVELQIKQIDKLKEYKVTLINSAVTGKIKVPEMDSEIN